MNDKNSRKIDLDPSNGFQMHNSWYRYEWTTSEIKKIKETKKAYWSLCVYGIAPDNWELLFNQIILNLKYHGQPRVAEI